MLSRRAALKGGTAVAASAALIGLAEAAPSPDAQLIAWEAELHQRVEAIDQQADRLTEQEVNERAKLIVDLDHRIAEMEAHTAQGLAVKLRRLKEDFHWGEGDWTKHNFRTMLASLENLAGRSEP